MATPLLTELEENGVIVLPGLVAHDQLSRMQKAFGIRLKRMRWNDVDGYVKSDPSRHFVNDLLTVDQAFLDVALHPLLKEVLCGYMGTTFEIVEAKGWLSIPTRLDFHGWHGDAWYDQRAVQDIPRELKLGIYLTDVRSGAFNYIRGTHRKYTARVFKRQDLADIPADRILEIAGPAGTAFLFDTSGIHRQSVPVLEPRWAIFYAYHDPHVSVRQEDLEYYRYHPMLLNAAFLGDLTEEDRQILGFGNKASYQDTFDPRSDNHRFEKIIRSAFDVQLRAFDLKQRTVTKLNRVFRQILRQGRKGR
jgi:hypothetical protein